MRLIDLDELLKFPIRIDHYDTENGNKLYVYGVEAVLEYAKYLPTVDAVPVRHGKWIKTGQSFVYPNKFINYSCSLCGNDIGKIKYNYCPYCGAKMRKEE